MAMRRFQVLDADGVALAALERAYLWSHLEFDQDSAGTCVDNQGRLSLQVTRNNGWPSLVAGKQGDKARRFSRQGIYNGGSGIHIVPSGIIAPVPVVDAVALAIGEWTWCAWVKRETATVYGSSTAGGLWDLSGVDVLGGRRARPIAIGLTVTAGTLLYTCFRANDDASHSGAVATNWASAVPDYAWHHLTLRKTVSGGNQSVEAFIDGVSLGPAVMVGANSNIDSYPPAAAYVGVGTSVRTFDGVTTVMAAGNDATIDDVRLYSKALTNAQIAAIGTWPSFAVYADKAGSARAQPAIVGLGGGVYGFEPSAPDESTGTVALVTTGASTNKPARLVLPVYDSNNENQFAAALLEDAGGALWVGAAPTMEEYRDASGVRRAAPTPVAAAGDYLWTVTPTAGDITAEAGGLLLAPTGAIPSTTIISTVSISPWSVPSPGAAKDAASDVAAFLDLKPAENITLEMGVNLFVGPMRSTEMTCSPALFVRNTGGAAATPYLHTGRKALFRPTVQLVLRGSPGEIQDAENMGRAIFAWLHQQAIAPYVQWLAVASAFALVTPEDSMQHPVLTLNLECQYVAELEPAN
jgi:hypothetical protein